MAKPASKTAAKTSTAVAQRKATLPATRAPLGRGFEEADADSFAIPFLAMLQKGTPQADPDDPAYIKGAKPGMFMNTVTLELFTEVERLDPSEFCNYIVRGQRSCNGHIGNAIVGVQ